MDLPSTPQEGKSEDGFHWHFFDYCWSWTPVSRQVPWKQTWDRLAAVRLLGRHLGDTSWKMESRTGPRGGEAELRAGSSSELSWLKARGPMICSLSFGPSLGAGWPRGRCPTPSWEKQLPLSEESPVSNSGQHPSGWALLLGLSTAPSTSACQPFMYWWTQGLQWSRHESWLNKSLNFSFFFCSCPVPNFFFSVAAFIVFSHYFAKTCLHFKNMKSSSNSNIVSPICHSPFDFTGFIFVIYRPFSFLYDPNYPSFLLCLHV